MRYVFALMMFLPLSAQAFVVGLNDAAHSSATLEAGVQSIRMSHGHGKSQAQMDAEVDWAADRGLGVLLFLGYGHQEPDKVDSVLTPAGRQQYADRSADLVRRYGGKVQYYEVWNEWNGGLGLGRYPGCLPACQDGAMYADLLCRTHKAIKAARPEAIVVGGATAGTDIPFITKMMGAGAGLCMDRISVHPYPYHQSAYHHVPSSDSPASEAVERFMFGIDAVDAVVKQKHGSPIKFLISEEGRQGSGEALTAQYLTALYSRVKADRRIEGMWWFNLQDASDIGTYGLLRANGSKKPAFFAFQSTAAAGSGGPHVEPPVVIPTPPPVVAVSPDGTTIPPADHIGDVQLRRWTLSGGKIFVDGVVTPSSGVNLLLKHGGIIYQRNSAGNWWRWVNGAWSGTVDPRAPPVVTPPVDPPVVMPPPDEPAASMLCEKGVDAKAVGVGVMLRCHE